MENNILIEFQSGFRSGHSTITAAMLTTNDIITCLDNKQYCAALFVDLSKAFDSVDHKILLQRLSCLGFSKMSLHWFNNYLTERMQCVSVENFTSTELKINKGVPQGSILAPVLFSLYINDMGQEINTAKINLYADDTIIYTVAQSMNQAIELLQDSFRSLQFSLIKLKLVLNANKTKYMFFTRCRTKITVPPILTLEGDYIERVNSYKYLGIWLDERLGFNIHIENLLKKAQT